MKKIVILIYFFSILLFQGKAQQYQPIFGEETTEWLTPTEFVALDQETGTFREMLTISINGDEGEYKILECDYPNGKSTIGKMRANETNSKLYFIKPNFTTEVLIMDLDLEVGDSFNVVVKLFNKDIEYEIFVDSVYVQDGKKHIRFDDEIGNAFSGKTKRMFIEGVGPNWGFNLYDFVVCKYADSVQNYSLENEYIEDCDFRYTHIDNLIKENDIKIYPNPVLESVSIHISENAYLSIYDSLGTKVLDKMLSNFETVLDVSHLPSNIYYFKFQMSSETITKKIVKY